MTQVRYYQELYLARAMKGNQFEETATEIVVPLLEARGKGKGALLTNAAAASVLITVGHVVGGVVRAGQAG